MNCIGSEGDGVDSNGTILISGGELYIAGSGNSADAALDADGGILINGGYVFAAGSLGMVETPASNSSQYCSFVCAEYEYFRWNYALSLRQRRQLYHVFHRAEKLSIADFVLSAV